MTSDTAAHFAPLEVAIRTKFLPALLGIAASDLDGEFRELLTHAQNNLGGCYKNGTGVAKDEKEAVKWYTKPAEQGDAEC